MRTCFPPPSSLCIFPISGSGEEEGGWTDGREGVLYQTSGSSSLLEGLGRVSQQGKEATVNWCGRQEGDGLEGKKWGAIAAVEGEQQLWPPGLGCPCLWPSVLVRGCFLVSEQSVQDKCAFLLPDPPNWKWEGNCASRVWDRVSNWIVSKMLQPKFTPLTKAALRPPTWELLTLRKLDMQKFNLN